MNIFARTFAKQNFSGQKKVRIMRQLQRQIQAGIPLNKSLEELRFLYSKRGKKPKEPLAMMLADWQLRYSKGKTLSQSMHGWISPAEELIIEAGEQSERLASSLEDALEANGSASKIRNVILLGLAYPTVLFAALCFMMYGFSIEIVPAFSTILPPEEWPGKAAIMYAVSQFVTNWMLLLLMVTGAAITAIFLSFPILLGPARKYLDKLPPWSIYKIVQGASFMIAMRGFLSAGLPVTESLRRMLRTGNPYFRERVAAILAKHNMGRNLGEAMHEAGHDFPDNEISSEISIYAELESSAFSESLDILAKEWITSAVLKAQIASKLMTYALIFLIAVCAGFMTLAVFELQDAVTNAAKL